MCGKTKHIRIGQLAAAGGVAFEGFAAAVIGAAIVSCVFVRAADKKYSGQNRRTKSGETQRGACPLDAGLEIY